MRKCLDCNEALPDVAMKCTNCGSENLSVIEEAEQPFAPKEKKSLFVPIVIIVAVIIGICAVYGVYQYSSYSVPAKPVEDGLSALVKGDCQGYIDEMHSEFQSDFETAFTSQFGTFEAYEESQVESLSDTFGNDYEIKTKVIDVLDISDISIAAISKNISDTGYNVEISDAKYVTVRIIFSGDDGIEDYSYESRYAIEVDGNWYLYENQASEADVTSSDTQTQD